MLTVLRAVNGTQKFNAESYFRVGYTSRLGTKGLIITVDFHFRWNACGRCSRKFMVGAVSHIYIAAYGAYKP